MDAKFPSDFWSDDDIMNLTADLKLAFCWLKTNDRCNNIGFQVVSRRKFRDETALPEETLGRLFETLPRHFKFDCENDKLRVLILGFLGEQWSPGQFSKPNNISLSLCKLVDDLPASFRSVLLDSYQSLASLYQAFKNGQVSSQSLPRDKSRAEQSRAEHSSLLRGSGGVEAPSDAEVLAFALTWPGEPATGAPQIPEDFAADWLKRMNGRTAGWPLEWRRAFVADWRASFRGWQKNGEKKPRGSWDLKTQLEGLQRQIATHPANEDSAAFTGDPTPAQLDELTQLQSRQRELSRQLGGVV